MDTKQNNIPLPQNVPNRENGQEIPKKPSRPKFGQFIQDGEMCYYNGDLVSLLGSVSFMRQRASGATHSRFGINSFELDLLLSLSAFSARVGKSIVSKIDFFGTLSGNSKRYKKYQGYLVGLVRGEFVATYEYIPCRGSLSLCITELGHRVLNFYSREINRLLGLKLAYSKPSTEQKEKRLYRPIAHPQFAI